MSISSSSVPAPTPPGAARRGGRPGIALAVIVACQLLVVLDGTIVNIALPSIQDDLHFSATGRSWVVTTYTLAFGGLLLLGGRLGDVLGRRRLFVAGVAIFTVASLAGGLADTAWLLLTARGAQGVGAALAAPGTLSLIITNFPGETERGKAMGYFSAVAGSGMVVGLILGGLLTTGASWRWVMFINVPIGIAIAVLAPLYVAEPPRRSGRFDVLGALTSAIGMASLAYGFIRVGEKDWQDGPALAALAVGAVMLAAFVVIESRAGQPIMPLRLLADRNRASAYLAMLLLPATMFSLFFFLTQHFQEVLGYSALEAGLAFLPMAVLQFAAARSAPTLLPRFGPKPLVLVGGVAIVAGMAWLTRLSADSGYLTMLVGPSVLVGAGVGLCFMPLNMAIMTSVPPQDAGSASGLLQSLQQVGVSIGLAVMVTVFGTAVRDASPASGASSAERAHQVLAHGIASAFGTGLVIAVLAFAVLAFGLKPKPRPAAPPAPDPAGPRAEPQPARD